MFWCRDDFRSNEQDNLRREDFAISSRYPMCCVVERTHVLFWYIRI